MTPFNPDDRRQNRPPAAPPANAGLIRALEANWQEEMEGAATYRALAEREPDPRRKATLQELADAETRHAQRWAGRLRELGAPAPVYRGAATGQADRFANRIGGPSATLRRIEMEGRQDVARYGRQIKELGDEPSIAILEDLMAEERAHFVPGLFITPCPRSRKGRSPPRTSPPSPPSPGGWSRRRSPGSP